MSRYYVVCPRADCGAENLPGALLCFKCDRVIVWDNLKTLDKGERDEVQESKPAGR